MFKIYLSFIDHNSYVFLFTLKLGVRTNSEKEKKFAALSYREKNIYRSYEKAHIIPKKNLHTINLLSIDDGMTWHQTTL